jgi:long-chain acyl-CoA synthetase
MAEPQVQDATLLEHLLRWAEVQPTAPFLHVPASGFELSYESAVAAVTGFARSLHGKGVRRGGRVYLALENDWTWVIGFLAAEAIGAIAVAANTRLSAAETAALFRDSEPDVVLTDEWQAAKVPTEYASRTLLAGDIPSSTDDVLPGSARDPAVLAYSSGTTGEPKGVLLSAQSVARSSATYAALFNSTPLMRTAVTVPLFHNTGFVDGLGHTLVSGGAVDLMRRFDATAVGDDLSSGRYNFFIGVPTMIQRIADAAPTAEPTSVAPWVAYGGAPMSRTTVLAFRSRFPRARMVNCYGLSEATSITHYLPAAAMADGTVDAIGIAVPGTLDRIVDDELTVRSPTRMIGYWHSAGLGHDDSPSLKTDDGGWLKTGDLVSRDDQGFLHILGRRDDLINRGGEKVSPREVEAALCDYPGITEAAVVGVPDRDLGAVPAAQVVLSHGEVLDEQQLRFHMIQRLADYKIPVCVLTVEELPRNANGKIHRAVIREHMAAVLAARGRA